MSGLDAGGRYHVCKRIDPLGGHDDCWYFVLDTRHDEHARPALLAYAESCEQEYPGLAADLRAKLAELDGGA